MMQYFSDMLFMLLFIFEIYEYVIQINNTVNIKNAAHHLIDVNLKDHKSID